MVKIEQDTDKGMADIWKVNGQREIPRYGGNRERYNDIRRDSKSGVELNRNETGT